MWGMAFAFERTEPVGHGAQRVAAKQLTKALDALESRHGTDLREVVHGVRKRGKRVRAVARLVRSGLGDDYKPGNIAVRDAGRLLSPIRDGHALLGTFDALVAGADARPAGDLLAVRAGLVRRAEAATERAAGADADVEAAIQLLRHALSVVKGWDLADDTEVVAAGLRATYGRGRAAFEEAVAAPTPESFHEWRKATKHLWHQTQLLEPASPTLLHTQAHALHDLADSLGDDHDLAVLTELVRDDPDAFGGTDAVAAAVTMADARRADLERRAVALGARLYVERPKAFVARMVGSWEAWQECGDEEPAGEIATVAPPVDDLDDQSTSRLYALARAAGLPGRSSMTREDLIASLRAIGR